MNVINWCLSIVLCLCLGGWLFAAPIEDAMMVSLSTHDSLREQALSNPNHFYLDVKYSNISFYQYGSFVVRGIFRTSLPSGGSITMRIGFQGKEALSDGAAQSFLIARSSQIQLSTTANGENYAILTMQPSQYSM